MDPYGSTIQRTHAEVIINFLAYVKKSKSS